MKLTLPTTGHVRKTRERSINLTPPTDNHGIEVTRVQHAPGHALSRLWQRQSKWSKESEHITTSEHNTRTTHPRYLHEILWWEKKWGVSGERKMSFHVFTNMLLSSKKTSSNPLGTFGKPTVWVRANFWCLLCPSRVLAAYDSFPDVFFPIRECASPLIPVCHRLQSSLFQSPATCHFSLCDVRCLERWLEAAAHWQTAAKCRQIIFPFPTVSVVSRDIKRKQDNTI